MLDMTRKMEELEAFIDESIEIVSELDYTPVRFIEMRKNMGTIAAIKACVCKDEETSGFKWVCENDLSGWSLEAAVVKFPQLFDRLTLAFAKVRLAGTRKE